MKGIAFVSLVLLLSSCHDGPGGDPSNDAFVVGVAYLGGPIAEADVVVYQLESATGARGVVRGRGRTDAAGRFEVDVGAAINTVELDVIGGHYLDVASGATVVRATDVLHGLAFELGFGEKRVGVAVTPWSHLAYALGESRATVEDGGRGPAMAHARDLLAAHLDFDPTSAAIASLDQVASTPTPEVRHALALAGLATMARLASDDGFADVTAARLVDALATDAADQLFDGEVDVTAVCPPAPVAGCDLARSACEPTCRVTSHALRATLANAIRVYVYEHAATGQTAATLASWLERLRTADEPLLFPPGPAQPLDARGPRVVWLAPVAGGAVTGTIAVEARASDPIGVATLTIAAGAPFADEDGAPEHATGTLDTTALPEGTIAIRATATDRDGNVTYADRPIVVDNLAAGSASGVVVKGRVAGATVHIYAYDGGVPGPLLGAGTTASDGTFTNIAIAGGYSGGLLIEAGGGGSYGEDAAPGTATLDLDDHLRTVVVGYADGGAVAGAVVSPLTTWATTYAGWLRTRSPKQALAAQWRTATGVIAAWSGVGELEATVPREPAQIVGDGTADRYGLVLIGLSQLAYRASSAGGGDAGSFATAMDSMRIVTVLDADLADGCLDGKAGATPLVFGGTQRPTDQTLRLDLASAIAAYLRDPARDLTSVTVVDVLPLLDTLASSGPARGAGSCPGGGLFATAGTPFDRSSPTIVWQAPTPAEGAWVRGTIAVQATAEDDLDLAPSVTWLGGLVDSDGDPDNAVASATIATGSAPDGILTVAARAVDDAGNLGEVPVRTLQVDNTAPVLTVATTGFYAAPVDSLWTASTTPVLTGTVVEANLAAIVASRGATPIATASVVGSAWSLTLPAGTVADAAGVELRIEARDRAGNLTVATRRLHYDATPPVLAIPPTTVKDEAGDTVTYRVTSPIPFGFVPYDPFHVHGGVDVTLGTSTACDTSAPQVVKYAYLLDENAPVYGSEQARNPLRWALTVTDDGVGVDPASVAYRVRDVGRSATALDWQAVTGPAVSLYRRGRLAPSIPALATDGLFAIDFRGRDWLGREVTITRCWNHRALPAPVLVGPVNSAGVMVGCSATGPTACAANHGPTGSGKYALRLLSLADTSSPVDPIGAQVLSNGALGVGLMEYPVWNSTSEPVYLTIDLATPVGATYTRRFVDGRWALASTSTAACGDENNGIDTSNPFCVRISRPTDPVPDEQGTSSPAGANVMYGVRIWEQLSPSSFVELTGCAGCDQTPAVGPRLTVTLPGRAPPTITGDPWPPRKFWVVPVVKGIPDMRPGGTAPFEEFTVDGVTLTGQVIESRQGCNAAISYSTTTRRYTCPRAVVYLRYRALSSASGATVSFGLASDLFTTASTSPAGSMPRSAPHLGAGARRYTFTGWQTTELPLPPTP